MNRRRTAEVFGLVLSLAVVLSASPLSRAQGPAPLELRFSRDFQPGSPDRNGRPLGGTETMALVVHKGMLWAAIGAVDSWTRPAQARSVPPGAQVILKRGADAPWEVDLVLDSTYLRPASMTSVRFTTDRRGQRLPEPVEMLLMGASWRPGVPPAAEVWARDDAAGRWTRIVVTDNVRSVAGRIDPEVRVLFDHADRVTGVHHVFAGVSSGAVYRGTYEPSVPGRIAWEREPELAGRVHRPMAAAEANGVLYLTVDAERSRPGNGGLFRRVDGPSPRWEWVYEWAWSSPNPDLPFWNGMRGLTAARDPSGSGEVLLGAREQPGVIERIDPARNHAVTQEIDVHGYFARLWTPGQHFRGATLIAYNDMTPANHPMTRDPIHLIGAWITGHPQGPQSELGASSWYLVRHRDGSYAHGRVVATDDPNYRTRGGLRGTRTIVVSPFGEDRERVFYFGGFDAFGGPHRDTAWIYKATAP